MVRSNESYRSSWYNINSNCYINGIKIYFGYSQENNDLDFHVFSFADKIGMFTNLPNVVHLFILHANEFVVNNNYVSKQRLHVQE